MKEVRVEYVDVESGQTVERATLPVERVPHPLELKARLTLGESHWVVVRAEPAASDAVAATGRLRLTVRRVADLVAPEIEYEAPTLAACLPALGDPLFSDEHERAGAPAVLERDAWRQVELHTRSSAEPLAQELLSIRRAHQSARVVSGASEAPARGGAELAPRPPKVRYRELHLRSGLLPEPIPSMGFEWLANRFPGAVSHALHLAGLRLAVKGGFALRGESGLLLYGVATRGRVEVFGLARPGAGLSRHALYHDLNGLCEVAEVHGLVLVDWCAARVYPPSRFGDALD